MSETHEVFNQPPPLVDYDAADDPALLEALRREGGEEAEVRAVGKLVGSGRVQELTRLASECSPTLRTHDRYGYRIDEVEYHPAWHELMRTAVSLGLAGSPWRGSASGAHVVRAAKYLVWATQSEQGNCCPVTMTYAAVPALRSEPELADRFEPLLTSSEYDFGLRPPESKHGIIAGMAMTEKQGGSDVRANTTRAEPAGDGTYRITGHKWFCSAPMSDVFLVLAQAPGGLTCFLLPRVLPDGERNRMRLQRLKEKLGNRSNASSEVEYEGAVAWRVGEEGRGVRTIIEMVNMTRLDCVIGAAGGMRWGLHQAVHHARHREAFGRRLIEQPLMRNVLADLATETEAAIALALRLAGAVDRSLAGDAGEAAFRRLAIPVSKYWVTKRWPAHAAECLECLGGNGYIEESGMPRLYREAPLYSIWEGAGNVAALDVLRAMKREPESLEAFFAELGAAAGVDRRLDGAVRALRRELSHPEGMEPHARRLVERMALALQGSLLVRHGHPAVADAFCASRLAGEWGHAFGTLPEGPGLDAILRRVLPGTGGHAR
ncbi:DNA alkylation response protein [Rubrobacter taiwanensis]|jgi:putative acyl-CoA dehydrogenase|uniref:DNA alkylation response protein n=1 Tax=Rubrobacter taiwanensis TaxID=185139 RepID=A0A4R1BLN2_9ACTN|nr:acyl-CoA dehydrogenase family protein [Rubrobacter taiwanensis]TCJ18284.1 DNA alkylation response protein [Rubrobacter taiwanensis]